MANNWLIEQTIDLQHGVQAPLVWPNALMLCGDNNAHTWRVMIMDGGESAQITGNITGYFVRTDGNTVTVTGGLTGNVATVTLPQACYATDGDLYAVMRLKSSSGMITLSALILPVRNVLTDSIIDPGEVIPSLDDLLAQIDACEEATDAANDAADAANQAAQSVSAVESDVETAEAARVTAEQGRVAAEQARAAAEAERVANEDERQQQLTDAINAAEADADRAEAAADAAETLVAMPPLFSDTPPADEPTLNKLWVDTGVSPTMMRRWRGADVPTIRGYNYDIFGCGKNLLPPRLAQTVAGVTYTPQSDGTYIANGTCTEASTLEILPPCVLPPGTYALSGGNGGVSLILAVYDAQGGWLENLATSRNGAAAVVQIEALSGNEAYHRVIFQGTAGTTMNNVVLSPQLESGDAATAYDPHKDIPFLALDNGAGQMQRVAVEVGCRAKQETRANLFDPSAITSIPGSGSGVTLSHAADGGIQIAGMTGDGYAVASNAVPAAQYVKLPEGALTASIDAPAGVHMLFRLLKDGTTVEGGDLATNSQRTQDIAGLDYDSVSIGVQVSPNTTVNATVHPMLNAGTQALPFEAYKTVLPITGRESVNVRACGKNLFDYLTEPVWDNNSATHTVNDGVISVTPGGVRASGIYYSIRALRERLLGQTVTLSFEIRADASFSVHGMGLGSDMWNVDASTEWQRVIKTNVAALTQYNELSFYQGSAGTPVTFYIRNIQIERGSTATEYEPYRDLGGGEITPSAPLYGLPGAEDTVEVSVDGDVLVTRRTAVLELDGTENWVRSPKNNHGYYWRLSVANIFQITTSVLPNIICSHYQTENPDAQWASTDSCISQNNNANLRTEVLIYDTNYAESDLSAWKAYLAAQKTAGTPVTIVYELATPTTETPVDVNPIVPEKGQLNIFTDADALSTTVHGSGWDTISDQTGLLATIAQLTARVAALEAAAVSTINNTTEG